MRQNQLQKLFSGWSRCLLLLGVLALTSLMSARAEMIDPASEDYAITAVDTLAPYPREYIIDREGRIAYTASNIDTEAMAAVLDELL